MTIQIRLRAQLLNGILSESKGFYIAPDQLASFAISAGEYLALIPECYRVYIDQWHDDLHAWVNVIEVTR